MIKKIGLLAGPIACFLTSQLPFAMINEAADPVIAVALWMIIWWLTEAVSISVTALIPLAFFPLFEIEEIKTVAASYGSPIVFLFFGGFVMALALEKVNLHTRIALNIVRVTGTTPDRVILGFMIATAFLSMWISNTATTVVMLPIGLSVISLLKNDEDGFTKGDQNFALALMLGIAYAANVGGISTIIGTPPNTIMVGFVEQEYQITLSFLTWMVMGVPFSTFMIGVVYIVLVKWVYPNNLGAQQQAKPLIDSKLAELGPIRPIERQVLFIFFSAMFLWVFRAPIDEAVELIKLSDAGISLLAAFALFTIPFRFNQGEFVLEWEDTRKLPWGILILFGGGLALASALSKTGVITFIGEVVSTYQSLSMVFITAMLIAIMLFMTELMSNVALVAVFAPVVAGIAIGLEQDMLELLIPVTLSASCAFMLPMATPPNAIVFASGYIKVHEMARAGFILNVISILILILVARMVIPVLF